MVEAATKDNKHFEASRIELEREGPSYTADTVSEILDEYGPEVRVYLIIGGDNVRTLRDWKKADYLIQNCHFLVAPRLVYERTLAAKTTSQRDENILKTVSEQTSSPRYDMPGAQVSVIEFPAVSISSSMVRKRLHERRSVLYMVPKSVNDILLKKHHYAGGSHTHE